MILGILFLIPMITLLIFCIIIVISKFVDGDVLSGVFYGLVFTPIIVLVILLLIQNTFFDTVIIKLY